MADTHAERQEDHWELWTFRRNGTPDRMLASAAEFEALEHWGGSIDGDYGIVPAGTYPRPRQS